MRKHYIRTKLANKQTINQKWNFWLLAIAALNRSWFPFAHTAKKAKVLVTMWAAENQALYEVVHEYSTL